MNMIATNIAETAEKVLLKYLAPDAAKTAAQEVADASASGLTHEIAHALAGLLGESVPAAKTPAKTPAKPSAPASKKPAAKAAPAKKAATPAAGGSRVLTDQARKVMSFKKAVYHATNRAAEVKKGKRAAPEPWDALVLKAHSEGKIISVDWAKKQANAAQKREAKGTNGHAKKAPPAKKDAKKADPAPTKKVANGAGLQESAPL
jgi:hypothetical protein